MEGFPQRQNIYRDYMKEKGITSGKIALHSFSDTRQPSRSDNLDYIVDVYPALPSMFQQMFNESQNVVAIGLLVRNKQFNFVAVSLVLQKCFSLSRHASEYLQSEEMNFVTAAASVEDLAATFQSLRSEDELNKLISSVSLLEGQIHTLEVQSTSPKRRHCFRLVSTIAKLHQKVPTVSLRNSLREQQL